MNMKNLFEYLNLEKELDDFDIIHEKVEKDITFKGTNLWILVFAIFVFRYSKSSLLYIPVPLKLISFKWLGNKLGLKSVSFVSENPKICKFCI